jgi:ParB-like chromosome segregation protein Spo0J
MIESYTNHPAADLFPMIEGKAWEEFKEDIRKNGFLESITLYRGQILDGRNRYRAAIELGKLDELGVAEFDDDHDFDPFQWVLSQNLHRRHLTESQRGMVAARLAKLNIGVNQFTKEDGQICPPSIEEAAEQLRVSRSTVKNAKSVIEHGSPELIAAVERGEVAVSKAAKIAKEKKQAAKKSKWLKDELERKKSVESGRAVVANLSRDTNLIQWAEQQGLAVQIDRKTKYGNPFVLDQDGDRGFVCDCYEQDYLPKKKSILKDAAKLRGKVLLCHCYPLRCHGEALVKLAHSEAKKEAK